MKQQNYLSTHCGGSVSDRGCCGSCEMTSFGNVCHGNLLDWGMFQAMWNLFFGCRHRSITRPRTPMHKAGTQPGQTYVACLECGKQFHYDFTTMRLGKAMPEPENSSAAA